jgi:hypothetical protein
MQAFLPPVLHIQSMRLSYGPVWTTNIAPRTRNYSAHYLCFMHHVNQCYRIPSSEGQRAASPLQRFTKALNSGGKLLARVQMRQVLRIRRSYIDHQYHSADHRLCLLCPPLTSSLPEIIHRSKRRPELQIHETRSDNINALGGTLLVRSATLHSQLS